MKMPQALVYSRSTSGHRQIDCNVLGRYLLARGFQVVFAVGRPCDLPQENMERALPLIECFLSDIRAQIEYFFDATVSDNEKELEHIEHLNAKHHIVFNIFADSDVLRRALSENLRTKGETAIEGSSFLIFLRLGSLDPVFVSSHESRLIVPVLIKLRKCAGDFWFFRHVLPKCIPKSQWFVFDPRFGRLFFQPSRLYWLPDIYAPFDFDSKAQVRQEALWVLLMGRSNTWTGETGFL